MEFGLLWVVLRKNKNKKKKQKQKNKSKTKQNCFCLVFVNILGIIKGHLDLSDLLFLRELGESIVRSFSMDLGNTLGMRFGLLHTRSLDHYLHHHSHLIVTFLDLAFLGRVVCRCHTLPHLYPSLFLHFIFALSIHQFYYPFQSSPTLIDRRLAS